MNAAEIDCATIARLRWPWLDGELGPADSDAYEQHLLFCPPCLTMTANARAALHALVGAAGDGDEPPPDLLALLTGGTVAGAADADADAGPIGSGPEAV